MIDSRFGLHDASGREQSSFVAVSAGQSAVPTDLNLGVSVAGTGSHGARRPARRATGSGGHLQRLENQDSPGRSSQEDCSGFADRTGVLAGATTHSGAAGEERQSVCAATDTTCQHVPAATAARAAPDRHRGRSENRVGPN